MNVRTKFVNSKGRLTKFEVYKGRNRPNRKTCFNYIATTGSGSFAIRPIFIKEILHDGNFGAVVNDLFSAMNFSFSRCDPDFPVLFCLSFVY